MELCGTEHTDMDMDTGPRGSGEDGIIAFLDIADTGIDKEEKKIVRPEALTSVSAKVQKSDSAEGLQ